MAIPPLLDELLRAPGPVGHESAVAAIVRREAEALGAEVQTDVFGSTVARLGGAGSGPTLALFAHVDEVGLAVAHIRDDGLLSVHRLAASKPAAFVGQRVEVLTDGGPVLGIVAWSGDGDEVRWRDLHVDVGAASAEEARELVTPGDPIVRVGPPAELSNGRVLSKALDNRASVYAALETLRALEADPPAVDVCLVATVQEETTQAGARVKAAALQPDLAVVLDVTYATDAPGADPRAAGDHRLGGGPAIFRGPTIHPGVFDALRDAAQEAGIAHSIETGERTMTDADSVFLQGEGIPTGLVSIPLRYMHTAGEVVQLSDVQQTTRLLVAVAHRLEPDASVLR